MGHKQIYSTPKRRCSRCLYPKRDTEKVSERIHPPAGGYLCPECLVPAAIEALEASKGRPERPEKDTRPSITCPECKRTSYNPQDISQGYCGNCNWWTSHSTMRRVPKNERS